MGDSVSKFIYFFQFHSFLNFSGRDVILFPDGAFNWVHEDDLPQVGEILGGVFQVSRVGIQKSIGNFLFFFHFEPSKLNVSSMV